jgi:hypothetical protein
VVDLLKMKAIIWTKPSQGALPGSREPIHQSNRANAKIPLRLSGV